MGLRVQVSGFRIQGLGSSVSCATSPVLLARQTVRERKREEEVERECARVCMRERERDEKNAAETETVIDRDRQRENEAAEGCRPFS